MRQTEVRQEEEKMLKSNSLAFVDSQSNQPSSDDLAIDIEAVPTTSTDLGGPATTFVTLLEEEEEHKTSDSDSQVGEKRSSVSKLHRQPETTQNLELKVSIITFD